MRAFIGHIAVVAAALARANEPRRPRTSSKPPFAPDFGKRGELRQPVGKSGRIHLDRWLPFIVLHRSLGSGASIARRVAVNSPAYLIWSPEDDRRRRASIRGGRSSDA